MVWSRRKFGYAALAASVCFLQGIAPAASTADPAAPPPAQSAGSGIAAEVAAQITPLLPSGARLDGVTLGCTPPAGATVAEVAPGMTRLASRGLVVMLRSDGGREIACPATCAAQRQILAAARDIGAGEPVTLSDLQPQWVDAFSGAPNALAQLPQTGLVAASTIRAGQPLYPWELTRPIAFRPGDLVMVSINNGPVTLHAMLEANSSAAVGDSATLINPETRTPVIVTVTGAKSAEVVMR